MVTALVYKSSRLLRRHLSAGNPMPHKLHGPRPNSSLLESPNDVMILFVKSELSDSSEQTSYILWVTVALIILQFYEG